MVVSSGTGKSEDAVEGFADGFWRKNVEEKLHIESNNDGCRRPTKDLDPERVDELLHLGFLAGEPHKWPDREAKLHAQHNLACYQQHGGLALPVKSDDAHSRNDCNSTGDQSPHPRRNSEVQKTFHHYLSRQCAGERRVLARGQQG